jgi:hypothetical protein
LFLVSCFGIFFCLWILQSLQQIIAWDYNFSFYYVLLFWKKKCIDGDMYRKP